MDFTNWTTEKVLAEGIKAEQAIPEVTKLKDEYVANVQEIGKVAIRNGRTNEIDDMVLERTMRAALEELRVAEHLLDHLIKWHGALAIEAWKRQVAKLNGN